MLIPIAILLSLIPFSQGIRSIDEGETSTPALSSPNLQRSLSPASLDEPDRYWGGGCSNSDLLINQGQTHPLPSGIPTYTVTVVNACSSGCDISGIHLRCGWFSSARLINPRIFRRLGFDDCLVYDGKPLPNGRAITFQYANTYPYRLSVSSIRCP